MTARVTLTRTVIFIYTSIFSQKPSFLKATAFSSLKASTTDYTKFNKLCGDYTMWKIYKPSSRGLWLDIFHKGSGNKPSDFLLYPLISESKGTIAFLCHPGPTRAKTWFYTGRSSPQGMMQPCAAGGWFHSCISCTCSDLSLIAPTLLSSSVSYRDSFGSGCQEGLQEDLCTNCFFYMDFS